MYVANDNKSLHASLRKLVRPLMTIFFQVSEVYFKVHGIISQPPVQDYVPVSWVSLTQVKREHYKALAHFFVALGLLDHTEKKFSVRAEELLQFLHDEDAEDAASVSGGKGAAGASNLTEIRIPKNQDEKRYLGEKRDKKYVGRGDINPLLGMSELS